MIRWPWRREPAHLNAPTDTGGEQARKRAEAALKDAQSRRGDVQSLRDYLADQVGENHFMQDILTTFRGERA